VRSFNFIGLPHLSRRPLASTPERDAPPPRPAGRSSSWQPNLATPHIPSRYPNRVLKGQVSNILPMVDPNICTAKVRLEVENPGLMRLGMFVTATFHGLTVEKHATVPATAILHLHDREWVYTPAENGRFRRLEVSAGNMLPSNLQEVTSGIHPGDKVISNALVFQNTVEQK
jgi:cobalt-zinc-cadmium efflux system membrane fusion protein